MTVTTKWGDNETKISWDLSRKEGIIGTGNWKFFPHKKMELIFESAAEWKKQLAGITKPWLCWCVDEEWCLLQQQLVASSGWTPIVGTDGSVKRPRLIDSAVFIDFNKNFQFPVIWMHFPLEFQFLFTKKLAFWHSDVLPPTPIMKRIANQFDSIADGSFVGVRPKVKMAQKFRRLTSGKPLSYTRWFEVVGCTTALASQSQYESGCGWWRHIEHHPKAKEIVGKMKPHWEHGVGISFWEKYFAGESEELSIDIEPFHYSTNKSNYIRRQHGDSKEIENNKLTELRRSFDLKEIIKKLDL